MALGTSIEWTEATWNPVTGCTKVSAGCKNCYAERMAERLQAMGQVRYRDGFKLAMHPDALDIPLKWRKPQTVFVNSMSDLFHEGVPVSYIQMVFDVMRRAHWHRFQVLTKRAVRLADVSAEISWPGNVWMGVSVENEDCASRIDFLRKTQARTKFLSMEPLLGPICNLDLAGIDWVIVGGESGPRSRHMSHSWVTGIRDQCADAGVPFFFKQWGGVNKKSNGRTLHGRTYDAMPCCG